MSQYSEDSGTIRKVAISTIAIGALALIVFGLMAYSYVAVEVPVRHIAVVINKTGKNLPNDVEIAPDDSHKGIQANVLSEGRYFMNPYARDWSVYPMVEIPENKFGVRTRLYGDDLPYGHFLAVKETDKGIVGDVLKPGRYPYNALVTDMGNPVFARTRKDYVELIELHNPITIPAGFKGIVTNLAGELPLNPNVLLVEKGFRGVQKETLEPGTYYLNPYQFRIEPIDCRSQRFNLSEAMDMGFPSKDGFWVSLDGVIEFRVQPEKAAEVFVLYNEIENDGTGIERSINEEIVRKVIMPNARSFCRLQGSNSSGRDFIGGATRTAFQTAFQQSIQATCSVQGVDIVQALITKIVPPEPIADPVRKREVNHQQLKQYTQQILQQEQEAKLAIEKAMVNQKKDVVVAEQAVIKLVTKAKQEQEVDLEGAERDKEVSIEELAAAKDQAAAIMSEKTSAAAIISYENEAKASGWKKSIEALNGDGDAFARYVLYEKLAPGYRSITTNTADSPLLRIFESFQAKSTAPTVQVSGQTKEDK